MVFHWSLSDIKSPQVSRTLLSIMAVLNNAVVWMGSTRPPTSKSSRPFSNPLVTVPNAPITIGVIVTCMFHSFFSSLARSRYLSFFSHSFCFILWSAGTAKSTILQVLFFCWLLSLFLLLLLFDRDYARENMNINAQCTSLLGRFGLIGFFDNGISTLAGYLMSKLSL